MRDRPERDTRRLLTHPNFFRKPFSFWEEGFLTPALSAALLRGFSCLFPFALAGAGR